MKRIYICSLTFILLTMMLTGCSNLNTNTAAKAPVENASDDKNSSQEITKRQYTVAFIPSLSTDAFFISMKRGIEEKAKEFNFNLIYEGPHEWDSSKQIPLIENFIERKVDLIILAPTNNTDIIEPIKKCVDAGIPVITVDNSIKDDSLIVSSITSDNFHGGRLAADILAKKMNYSGEVAIINMMPGILSTDDRQKGFEDRLREFSSVKLVSSQYCNDQSERAAVQIQEVYAAHPNLKGVFAGNLYAAIGCQAGLRARGLTDQVALVGYDAGPAQINALKSGQIAALIVQKPFVMGLTAGEYAYYYLRGQRDRIEKHKLIPSIVVTKDNVNNPEVKQWFYNNAE